MLSDKKKTVHANASTISASDQNPDTQNCDEYNRLQMNVQLFENIQLKYLINQFEETLNKVKKLELKHLLQPTQIATFKLKELQKTTEALACDYYGDNPCANKNCCNELDLRKILIENEKIARANESSNCKGYNMHCVKSCHCDVNEIKLDQNKKIVTSAPDVEGPSERKQSDRTSKCDPCRCSVDASGKKVKTLECRLASKARKSKTNETGQLELDDALQFKEDDTKLPTTKRWSATNILSERRISNSRLEIETNLKKFNLNVKKENLTIDDITYQNNVRERNQAVSCHLSSESSSEEYYSDHSSDDQISFSKIPDAVPHAAPHCTNNGIHDKARNAQVECSGCGQRVDTIKVDESEACPCGCGDAMSLPEGKYVDRAPSKCDNCGKTLAENGSLKN